MQLVKSYNNVTIQSELTLENLKKLQRHCPNVLTLKNEDKRPVFKVEYNENAGCITDVGISFDDTTADGHLFVTVNDKMPKKTEDARKYIEDNYGTILVKLGAVETKATETLTAIADEVQTISDSIVMG